MFMKHASQWQRSDSSSTTGNYLSQCNPTERERVHGKLRKWHCSWWEDCPAKSDDQAFDQLREVGSLLSTEQAYVVSVPCAMLWASTGNPKTRPRPYLLWGSLEPSEGDRGVSWQLHFSKNREAPHPGGRESRENLRRFMEEVALELYL